MAWPSSTWYEGDGALVCRFLGWLNLRSPVNATNGIDSSRATLPDPKEAHGGLQWSSRGQLAMVPWMCDVNL